jgi:antirestriction protein ArdC
MVNAESYSKEELVAEMTAAMLCGIVEIEPKILENSAAILERGLHGQVRFSHTWFRWFTGTDSH